MGAVELLIMVAMIAFNSFFAAYEIALAAVSHARLKLFADEKAIGGKAALYMKENVEGSLAAIQIGITLFGAIAAATGGAGAEEQIAPYYERRLGLSEGMAEFLAVATIVIPLTATTIVLGELVPKVFALRNKEWVCLKLSPAMRWFTFALFPAVWLFETIVSAVTDWGERRFRRATADGKSESAEMQELRAATAMARTSRLIGPREELIIASAARLTSRQIREIMLPAAAIAMLHADASLDDALVAAHLDMHTRFPVTDRPGDAQAIAGYVNVKDIVAVMRLSPRNPTLRSITRPIMSFAESETISSCLEKLLRENAHIALIRNAAGSVVGMVSLEDIVEELLGDIKDEYDRLPAFITASGSAWVVGGGATLQRIKESTGIDLIDLPDAAAETLSDWVVRQLGREVQPGDVLERNHVRAAVRKVRRHQAMEVQLAGSNERP
jgi:putative hemolysin